MPRPSIGNWNANDPNNPLNGLLQGRPLHGTAGFLYTGDPNARADLNGMTGLNYTDPRYFESYIQPGSEAGGGEQRYRLNDHANQGLTRNGVRYTQLRNTDIGGDAMNVVDPSLVIYDPEYGLLSPDTNVQDDPNSDGINTAMMVIGGGVMGGSALMHAMGGAGGGAAGDWGVSGSGNAGAGIGASGQGTLDAGLLGSGGGAGTSTAWMDGGGFGSGGLDPNTMAGQGGMGVGQNGIGPGSWDQILQGTVNNPSSLLGRAGDLASNAGSWAMRNPMQAYGLGQSLAGLGGGGGSAPYEAQSNYQGKGGTNTGGMKLPTQNGYWVNPFTRDQLSQTYGG